ncbi:winged helix DNA-binding domain-containing protein [Cylindrobasidium torrendii FP15055 ss-10]|uniref:Winged helix DNA-binding domain-containing protein n=1 Tax=Cylindrobasidium torrendii FP15055 ss-10 TaxID=1314674 RepID=A0A0D7BQY8_9AGAR|nr:winged helix DNA-binding domain-containing protein [Cylindrobasidium torrendii FP15055 ss-10]
MHRRRVGLAAFDSRDQARRFNELSSALSKTQVDHLQGQLAQFRTALAHFAAEHRDDIRRDPTFRHAFQQMCASIGVDPLAGPRRAGWWAEMLGLGDWQYELGVQIVDVCVSTRDRNGGIIEISELVRMVTKLRGVQAGAVDEDDVMRSIKTLQPLGAGYQVIDIGGRKMVRSVFKELNDDQTSILVVAHDTGGRVVEEDLMKRKGWTRERAHLALENMYASDGLCWIDDQDEESGRSYWISAAIQWNE